jgi:hypothetical protein
VCAHGGRCAKDLYAGDVRLFPGYDGLRIQRYVEYLRGTVERGDPRASGWWAMAMTRQYLRGEVLVLLSRLAGAAPCWESADALLPLRRQAETLPLDALPQILERALGQAEAWCWTSLGEDPELFQRECAIAADLYEFGLCSGLLTPKDPDPGESD